VRTVPRRGYAFTRPVSELGEPTVQQTVAIDPAAPTGVAASRRLRHWGVIGTAAAVLAVALVAWPQARTVFASLFDSRPAADGSEHALTVAVLPLRNLSGDVDQDYLAAALSDDLTTDLARLPNTLVIARASVVRFHPGAFDTRQIGKDLGVRYLVDGTLRAPRSGQFNRRSRRCMARTGRTRARLDEPITFRLLIASTILAGIALVIVRRR
jgi:hypothetical protein